MKYLKRRISTFAIILAIVAALSATTKTQSINKKNEKRVTYCWIKYDCHPFNSQPVNGPNNFTLASDFQIPYTLLECPDEVSKCAVKFEYSNTVVHPVFANSRLPINPVLELQKILCGFSI